MDLKKGVVAVWNSSFLYWGGGNAGKKSTGLPCRQEDGLGKRIRFLEEGYYQFLTGPVSI